MVHLTPTKKLHLYRLNPVDRWTYLLLFLNLGPKSLEKKIKYEKEKLKISLKMVKNLFTSPY